MTGTDVISFLVQAAIATASAFLAAFLATRKFREEKWWERKAAAYGELVEALHHMKWSPSETIDAAVESREIPQADKDELWRLTRCTSAAELMAQLSR